MDAVAERTVEQTGGRQQRGIAILLHHAARQAGDDRRYRDHPLGDAFETQGRLAGGHVDRPFLGNQRRSEEHTSELQSRIRISSRDFYLKKNTYYPARPTNTT